MSSCRELAPGESCPFCFSFFPAQKECSLVPHGGVLNSRCLIGTLFLPFLRYICSVCLCVEITYLGGKLVAILAS